MKHRILTVTLLAAVSLHAQDDPERPFRYDGSGHILFGAGGSRHGSTLHVGGGGEVFLFRGLSVGGDLGYHTFANSYTRLGIAMCDVSYHFVDRDVPRRLDPFVTGGAPGVTFSDEGSSLAGSIGGGLTYWFRRRLGIRSEYRLDGMREPEMAIHVIRVGRSFR